MTRWEFDLLITIGRDCKYPMKPGSKKQFAEFPLKKVIILTLVSDEAERTVDEENVQAAKDCKENEKRKVEAAENVSLIKTLSIKVDAAEKELLKEKRILSKG